MDKNAFIESFPHSAKLLDRFYTNFSVRPTIGDILKIDGEKWQVAEVYFERSSSDYNMFLGVQVTGPLTKGKL